MIKNIKIDGFRSLQGFEMDIKPGLNILIGPNGAGKTNIILFFEFLSYLVSQPLSRAVGLCGGIGNIFTRTGETTFVDRITCSVEGALNRYKASIRYKYEFEISVNEQRDEVYFSHQKIYFFSSPDLPLVPEKTTNWDLVVESNRKNEIVRHNVIKLDGRKFKSGFNRNRHMYGPTMTKEEQVAGLIKELNDYPEGISLLTFLRVHGRGYGFHYISENFIGGETFNIIPSKVKEPDDAVADAGINPDGSGLAATFYALEKGKRINSRPKFLPVRTPYAPTLIRRVMKEKDGAKIAETIIEQLKLINDQVLNISAKLDQYDNQIKLFAEILNECGSTSLPINLLSDGTVKWLALLTAIHTHPYVFAIEEPENFIHPHLQSEIISIMRTAYGRGSNRFILLTSHSETLLNASDPSEIILIKMEQGKTVAGRVADQKLINEEIQRTGFGLGYYYYAGALTHD